MAQYLCENCKYRTHYDKNPKAPNQIFMAMLYAFTASVGALMFRFMMSQRYDAVVDWEHPLNEAQMG